MTSIQVSLSTNIAHMSASSLITAVITACLITEVYNLSPSDGLFNIKPIEKFVEDQGYTIETHPIVTKDGYNLTYHRIPRGKEGTPHHGHPVLLAHGFLQSSAVFLAMDHGLAYLLADAGFDVWMSNARGNTYSRRHIKWHPDYFNRFWDFSFDEVGRFDLPAAIDHILSTTKRTTLSYIGFSLGTTAFWVLASTQGPGYLDKVEAMVAMAPVARPSSSMVVQNKAAYMSLIVALKSLDFFNLREVRPFSKPEGLMIKAACTEGQTNPICRRLLSTPMGLYPDNIHYDNSLLSTQYLPAGTSIRTLQHFLQMGRSGRFEEFDYGDHRENRKHYKGSPSPPKYDLLKVTCPVYLIYSDKDSVSVKEDVLWLSKQLPQPPGFLLHDAVKNFEHNDYFYSPDVQQTLYGPLVQFMSRRISKESD